MNLVCQLQPAAIVTIKANYDVGGQWNQIADGITTCVLGHQAKQRRKDAAADHRHDQERPAQFRVRSESLDTHGKDGWKHK